MSVLTRVEIELGESFTNATVTMSDGVTVRVVSTFDGESSGKMTVAEASNKDELLESFAVGVVNGCLDGITEAITA